ARRGTRAPSPTRSKIAPRSCSRASLPTTASTRARSAPSARRNTRRAPTVPRPPCAPNTIASVGDAGLLRALIVCGYVVGAAVAGARRQNPRLIRSAIYASYGAPGLLTFASAVMWFAILSNDYTIKYVQRHSDASMPWFYRFTAFWGGLDGSILWWVLLL